MSTKERMYLKSIGYLSENFPIVALLGARQVGKSTIMWSIDPFQQYFDLENHADYQRFARALDVSKLTVKQYLDIAEGTFLWRQF